MGDLELKVLRHRISYEIKKDSKQHFQCSDCGAGINGGDEIFVVTPTCVCVWCKSCWRERNA